VATVAFRGLILLTTPSTLAGGELIVVDAPVDADFRRASESAPFARRAARIEPPRNPPT